MPLKTTKRKAKAAAGGDDDVWDVLGEQPRKRTRNSGPRTTGSHIDEDSEDAGPKASRHLQSWAEWQKKFSDKEKDDKRQFASNFKQNTEKNREIVQQLISKSKKDLIDVGKKRVELFTAACVELEATADATPTFMKASVKTRQDTSLFTAGQELFKKCRDLVAVHEEANGKASAQEKTHTNERRALWKADMEQAQKAVTYGAQYGEKVIRCNVDLSSNNETRSQLLTPPRDLLNGPGQMALDMHQQSIEKLLRGRPTWADEALIYVDKFAGIAATCEQ